MEYISEILSFIVGLGSGFALHIASSKTNQNRNFVGGDLVGRDKISNSSSSRESIEIMNAIKDHVDKKAEEVIKAKIDEVINRRKG